VDLDAAQLFVAFSLAEDAQGHLVRKEPKTKASRRLIALPSITVEALRAHKARSKSDVGYVFTTGAGGPIWKRNFHSDVFKPLLKKAGLSDITFHSLRHTADTILLESGESLHVVQQRGG
jgi:integrase